MAYSKYIDAISGRPVVALRFGHNEIIEELHRITSYYALEAAKDAEAQPQIMIFSADHRDWYIGEVTGVILPIWERTNRLTTGVTNSMVSNSTEIGIAYNDYGRFNINLLPLLNDALKEYIVSSLVAKWYLHKGSAERAKVFLVTQQNELSKYGRMLTEFYIRRRSENILPGMFSLVWSQSVCTLSKLWQLKWMQPVCNINPAEYTLKWMQPVCYLQGMEDFLLENPGYATYSLAWQDAVCVTEKPEQTYDLKWMQPICNVQPTQYVLAWKNPECRITPDYYLLSWQDPVCIIIEAQYNLSWQQPECNLIEE